MFDLSDRELVRKAQRGDVAMVGKLYDRHRERIFRYVWARVRDVHLAEDLTGEIFARMVAALPHYRVQDVPFEAWLYRIARNLVVDFVRRRAMREEVPLQFADGRVQESNGVTAVVERQLTMERVLDALDSLDGLQREVILLRFVVGMPVKEVAKVLEKSPAAVKSLQHRGLRTLRALVKDD
ncbi:MAG: sigma-70 family RNA polymerase sigma factor [Chloroflexi bacterium]|nr:MAG: sigma-70 family RNA polymerase sigma factor [Chloroflexota bacterium]